MEHDRERAQKKRAERKARRQIKAYEREVKRRWKLIIKGITNNGHDLFVSQAHDFICKKCGRYIDLFSDEDRAVGTLIMHPCLEEEIEDARLCSSLQRQTDEDGVG